MQEQGRAKSEHGLSAHGIRIRRGILEDPERHFSEALASADGMQDVGIYMNQTTNRLSEALDGLDGWLEAQQGMPKARRQGAE